MSWERFDAAILMVPHYLHAEYAQTCLHANKHVLLEKPLAHSMESAVHLIEKATDQLLFMVAEQSPHWPEVSPSHLWVTHFLRHFAGCEDQGIVGGWDCWTALPCHSQLLGGSGLHHLL